LWKPETREAIGKLKSSGMLDALFDALDDIRSDQEPAITPKEKDFFEKLFS